MDTHTNRTCSFILKVWVEESGDEVVPALWRGHITHVMSGNRQYFQDFSTALHFMLPYFETMGIKIESNDLPRIA